MEKLTIENILFEAEEGDSFISANTKVASAQPKPSFTTEEISKMAGLLKSGHSSFAQEENAIEKIASALLIKESIEEIHKIASYENELSQLEPEIEKIASFVNKGFGTGFTEKQFKDFFQKTASGKEASQKIAKFLNLKNALIGGGVLGTAGAGYYGGKKQTENKITKDLEQILPLVYDQGRQSGIQAATSGM